MNAFADLPLYFNCVASDAGGYGWLSVDISSGSVAPGQQLILCSSCRYDRDTCWELLRFTQNNK